MTISNDAAGRYHVHGIIVAGDDTDGANITVTVDADTDDEAQALAWRIVPTMDVTEIESE